MSAKEEDRLSIKAEQLQTLLTRCSTLLHTSSLNHLPRQQELSNDDNHLLKTRVTELQSKIFSLEQYIIQLEDRLSQTSLTDQRDNTSPTQHITPTEEEGTNTNPYVLESSLADDVTVNTFLSVFRYLSPDDLFRVGRVCKQWRKLSHHPLLWQHLKLIDCSLDSKALVTIATRCSKTEHITLQGLSPRPAAFDEDLQSYIYHQKAGLEVGLKSLLQQCGQSIKTITISECSLLLTERCLWLISIYCPHLISLWYHSEEFPATSESLWSLANGCVKLQQLHLPPTEDEELVYRFNNDCLHHISQGFPLLSHLTLGGNGITLQGLVQLVSTIPNLQHLHVIKGPQMGVAGSDKFSSLFPSLISLTLTHTRISPQAVVKLLETHEGLKALQISISFTDYYPQHNSLTDISCLHKYQQILANFKYIEQHAIYGCVFQLVENPILTPSGTII